MIDFKIDDKHANLYGLMREYFDGFKNDPNSGYANLETDEFDLDIDNLPSNSQVKVLIEERFKSEFARDDNNTDPKEVFVLDVFSANDYRHNDQLPRKNFMFHHILSAVEGIKEEDKKSIKHLVIPIHKDGNHYTSLTIELNDEKKTAIIRYKDSFGTGMPKELKPQLVAALKHVMGYEIEGLKSYNQREQRDACNCGFFTVFNSVDMVTHANEAHILPTSTAIRNMSQLEYDRFFIEQRMHAVELLSQKGFKSIKAKTQLLKAIELINKEKDYGLPEIRQTFKRENRFKEAFRLFFEHTKLHDDIKKIYEEAQGVPNKEQALLVEEKLKNINNIESNLELMINGPKIVSEASKAMELIGDNYLGAGIRPFLMGRYAADNAQMAQESGIVVYEPIINKDVVEANELNAVIFTVGMVISATLLFVTIPFSTLISCTVGLMTAVSTGPGAFSYLLSFFEEDDTNIENDFEINPDDCEEERIEQERIEQDNKNNLAIDEPHPAKPEDKQPANEQPKPAVGKPRAESPLTLISPTLNVLGKLDIVVPVPVAPAPVVAKKAASETPAGAAVTALFKEKGKGKGKGQITPEDMDPKKSAQVKPTNNTI